MLAIKIIGSLHGKSINFNECIFWHPGYLYANAGGLVVTEQLSVHVIHSSKVADILKKNSGLANFVHSRASGN